MFTICGKWAAPAACDAAAVERARVFVVPCHAAPHSHGIYTFCRFFQLVFMTVFCLFGASESVWAAGLTRRTWWAHMWWWWQAVCFAGCEPYKFSKRKKIVLRSVCVLSHHFVGVCVSETACSSEYKRAECVKIIKEPPRSNARTTTKKNWEREKKRSKKI